MNTLTYIDQAVVRAYIENPHRSLSALFRHMSKRVPEIGEYPILAHIIRIGKSMGIEYTRDQIKRACRSTEEYKTLDRGEKNSWATELFDITCEVVDVLLCPKIESEIQSGTLTPLN